MSKYRHLWMGILICFSVFGGQRSVVAQIETDNTLSTEVRSSDRLNFVIEAGDIVDRNLFHSFDTFSVPTNGTAYFNQPLSIQNIISRVTGDSASRIDGLLQSNGTANVFLINPQGIVFGPEATLNIGGSFIGSTAQRVRFADGTVLGTERSEGAPQLTISQPLGLQLTPDSGVIGVQGNLGNVSRDTSLNQDIALVGNGVLFRETTLERAGGRIEIGSVSSGEVVISGPESPPFDYSAVEGFADIQIDATDIETVGPDGGDIQLRGQRVGFTGGSSLFSVSNRTVGQSPLAPDDRSRVRIEAEQILVLGGSQLGTQTAGVGPGNDLVLTADVLQVSGSDPANPGSGSRIVSLVGEDATNAIGGNILISAGELNVSEGSGISADLLGEGTGGDIRVLAERVRLQGPEAERGEFIIADIGTAALPEATGRAGNVAITTGALLLNENGALLSETAGQADAGNIEITADDIIVSSLSFISTVPDPGTTGRAGNISINTQSLRVLNGSEVTSNAGGEGRAGDITIQAEEVNVAGSASFLGFFEVQSGILAGVNPSGTGDGGSLFITSDRLSLDDGGVVANDIQGISGNAGEIKITTRETSLSNQSIISSASIGIDDGTEGSAGNIRINTTTLDILENSLISSNTFGTGDAGNIEIGAEEIFIQGSSQFPDVLASAGIVAGVRPDANGSGGDIIIEANSLVMQDRGLISSQSEGQGPAGNVDIAADSVLLLNQSTISSQLTEGATGRAGNITVTADDLDVYLGSQIVAITDGAGNGGNISIDAQTVDIQRPLFTEDRASRALISVEVRPEGTGESGNIEIVADQLSVGSGGGVLSRTSGDGDAGRIDIEARQINLSTPDLEGATTEPFSSIASNALSNGSAGSVRIVADEFTARDGGDVTVSSNGSGRSGDLVLTGRLIRLVDGGELSAESATGDRGNITVQPGDLLLLRDSRITTNATSTATGGNIVVDGGLVVLDGESQIVAQAIEGDGGNIRLRPIQLFRSDNSLLSASSALGVDGTVEIERIGEEEADIVDLDDKVLNPDQLVANSCLVASDRGSGQFLISGSGGLPATPTAPALSGFNTYDIPTAGLAAELVETEHFQTADDSPESTESAPLVEAGGLHRLADGQVVLARSCS